MLQDDVINYIGRRRRGQQMLQSDGCGNGQSSWIYLVVQQLIRKVELKGIIYDNSLIYVG